MLVLEGASLEPALVDRRVYVWTLDANTTIAPVFVVTVRHRSAFGGSVTRTAGSALDATRVGAATHEAIVIVLFLAADRRAQ